ncbi:MAG: hypothetical protein JRJ87_24955 [Deltaproteobacteria bacterium]|nr:hypothetical protein [Deltaproteobacteria bacterium]
MSGKFLNLLLLGTCMIAVLNCGGINDDPARLCELCLTNNGACADGCGVQDAELLSYSYSATVCDRGRQCTGNDQQLYFCELDFSLMNDCELLALAAYPDELQLCIESVPSAACDSNIVGIGFQQPEACKQWEEMAQAAIDDSTCHDQKEDVSDSGPGY